MTRIDRRKFLLGSAVAATSAVGAGAALYAASGSSIAGAMEITVDAGKKLAAVPSTIAGVNGA